MISTWIYGLLLLGEILFYLNVSIIPKLNLPKTTTFIIYIQKILTHPLFSKILAFLGFVAISVTGLLGGAMVYGVSADPFTGVVLRLLGIVY